MLFLDVNPLISSVMFGFLKKEDSSSVLVKTAKSGFFKKEECFVILNCTVVRVWEVWSTPSMTLDYLKGSIEKERKTSCWIFI